MSDNKKAQEHPSMVGGHVEYIKGMAESTVGNLTGSDAWTGSGEQAKAHAIETMKAANENRPANAGYGKVEEVAGDITGCGGMKAEGAATKQQ